MFKFCTIRKFVNPYFYLNDCRSSTTKSLMLLRLFMVISSTMVYLRVALKFIHVFTFMDCVYGSSMCYFYQVKKNTDKKKIIKKKKNSNKEKTPHLLWVYFIHLLEETFATFTAFKTSVFLPFSYAG